MINFVNTGADEAILKSMPTDGCSEDLVKAMSKQGLVQKDVTVQGKNGRTFTRKQWVKAGDTSVGSSGKQKSIPDAVKECGVSGSETVQELEKIRRDLYKEMTYYFKKYDKALASNASDANTWGTTAGGKQKRLGALDKYIKEVKSVQTQTSSTSQDNKKAPTNADNTAVQYKGRTITSIPAGITPTGYGNETFYFVVHPPKGSRYNVKKYFKTENEARNYIDSQSTALTQTAQVAQNPQGKGGQKLSKEDAKKKTQSYTSKVGKSDSERQAFMDKVKSQGITWKEDGHTGINWMRCCMAMNKHFAEGGNFDDSVKSKSGVTKSQYKSCSVHEPSGLVRWDKNKYDEQDVLSELCGDGAFFDLKDRVEQKLVSENQIDDIDAGDFWIDRMVVSGNVVEISCGIEISGRDKHGEYDIFNKNFVEKVPLKSL